MHAAEPVDRSSNAGTDQSCDRATETPTIVSTVDFKELGETKRNAVMERVIHATWGDTCKPNSFLPHGYSPNGSSQWAVHCGASLARMDYVVALPERASGNARVLKCLQRDARVITCNILDQQPPTTPRPDA